MGKGTKIPVPGIAPQSPKGAGDGDTEKQQAQNGTEMTAAQSSALEKSLSRFDKVDQDMANIKNTVDEGIKAQEFNAKQTEDKLDKHVQDCETTKREMKSIKRETDGLRARANFQNFILTDLEEKIEQLERERRRNIMIIEGMPETETLSPEIVDRLFSDLKLNVDSQLCDRVFRRGKVVPKTSGFGAEQTGSTTTRVNKMKPRPIVVSFVRPGDKGRVFKNLINLKGLEIWRGIYFSDDYTEQQKNKIRDLRALAAYLRRIGREASVRNHHLWVDGRRYVNDELNKLAPDLTLEQAKTIEVLNGTGLAFQSIHSPLSNLYLCKGSYPARRPYTTRGQQ